MLLLDLRKVSGCNKKHNLGKWELYFVKRKLYMTDNNIKQECLAITCFETNTIKIYSKQSIPEIKNSLRHELLHIIDAYDEKKKNIDREEIVCLQENLINYADNIIDKWFAEEI